MESPPQIPYLPGNFVNNATFNSQSALITGWVNQPCGRGTFEIVKSSLLTIFLCTWTAVCLNIPDRKDGKLQILWRRAKWMFWAIVGPEFVLTVAIGQRAVAQRSVKRFKGLGYPQWTIRHGFFADMGGSTLHPKDSAPCVVNGRQLAYLVEREYMTFPDISEADIWDRSKADTLTRTMTIVQASWLVIQIIARAIRGIGITTLELAAASIVFCTLGTSFCWLHKPSDVQKGVSFKIKASTAQILLNAGDMAKEPYTHTPLDFVAKQMPTVGYNVMKVVGLRCDSPERPLRRFPDDRFPAISAWEKFSLFSMTLIFAALHLVGWNFSFPTAAERYLWRIASWFITGTTFVFWTFETIVARHRFGRWDKYLVWLRLKRAAPLDEEKLADGAKPEDEEEKREREHRAAKPNPMLWEVLMFLPIVAGYVLARGYMIVEVFMSLRMLPLGAYNTVEWADFIPHL